MKPIPLSELVDALEMVSNDLQWYYDSKEEEFVFVSEEFGEDDDLLRRLEEGDDALTPLPSSYEIHEYCIMEDFVFSQEDAIAERLERAIRGRGAFRRFGDAVFDLGIRDEWFEFKRKALAQIGRRWCEEHGFEVEA